MYRNISQFYPKSLRLKYKKLINCSGIKIHADRFMGFLIFMSICVSMAIAFFSAKLIKIHLLIIFAVCFLAMQFLLYSLLMLRADAKGKFVEDILPDALQLMASNLRAGMTTDKALLLSARPEFGPLADELNIVGKETTMGKDLSKSLESMTERIMSEKLQKTILLITSGLRSGGELAALLSQTAQNLRTQKFVEEKVKSNVLMYVIFIFSAIGFGAPLLFALSSFLVETLSKSLGNINIPEETASQLPLTLSKVSISPNFVITYAIISLITTSILGSIVLGLIRKGKEREGIKYIPILLLFTLGVFFLVRIIISNVFGAAFF